MKTEICSDRVLVHFNSKLPIILSTDACNTAIAGILSHKYDNNTKRPIAYVSRALNNAEKNYSTIEKEALAIIFSVVKLKQYLLGMFFTLETDHRPLITIFGENKGIPLMAAARMQRWAFLLSGFDYTIQYIKGSLNTADSLSRIEQISTTEITEESTYINYVGYSNVTTLSYKDIAICTRHDPLLSKVMDCILNGTVHSLSGDIYQPFRTKADELTVESGCILWYYRTVIPAKLRKFELLDLHTSHMGIVKTKALARSYVYWPKIDNDIENLIKGCVACQKTQASPEKSPLIPWTPPDSAWKRIHIGFAGPIRGYFLFIVVDAYSKWIEVFKTKTITTAYTINKLKEVFSRYGLVHIIVSDNGTQLTSAKFEKFLQSNGIVHIRTAPGHPATNGQAENTVKTVKKSLTATIETNKSQDFDTILTAFLFDYRITKHCTHCTTNETLAKLLFGRELRSRFSLLKPPVTQDIIKEKQQTAIRNFKGNRNAKFIIGQKVYVRNYQNPNKDGWSQAKIKKQIGPRNYTCLLLHEKRDIKRHVNQIRNGEAEATEGDELPLVEDNSQGTEQAHEATVTTDTDSPFGTPTGSGVDSDSSSQDEVNASIQDVHERPASRRVAKQAKERINEYFKPNRR